MLPNKLAESIPSSASTRKFRKFNCPTVAFFYSTRQVPTRERLAYWQDMICATYAQLQSAAAGDDDVYGAVSAIDLDKLQVSSVQTTIQRVTRPTHLIARGEQPHLLVHLARAGVARVEHRSHHISLAPGEMTAYLTSEPYLLQFQGWSDTRVIKLPVDAVSSLLPGVEDLVGRRVPANTAELRILRNLLETVWSHHRELDAGSCSSVAEALRQAVVATLGTLRGKVPSALSKLEQFYLRSARAYIDQQLRSESLTADEIAAHVGISARHLSRLFSSHAVPLHQYVLEAKLKACSAELLRCRGTRGAIHTAAYAWGFSSPSHFSRVFRSMWGRSPSEWLEEQAEPGSPGL